MEKFKNASKYLLTLVLMIALLVGVVLCMGNATGEVSAETNEETEQSAETQENTLVGNFIARLKEKYGDDYLYYYNAVLEKWGSVEQYLLACVDETTPDIVANGWTAFINWLDKYAVIWAPIFAIVLVAIAALVGKKYIKKAYEYIKSRKKDISTIFGAINKMYKAHIAELQTLQSLLGDNERFADKREALEAAQEEIEDADV